VTWPIHEYIQVLEFVWRKNPVLAQEEFARFRRSAVSTGASQTSASALSPHSWDD
jgi:hypothetical protein